MRVLAVTGDANLLTALTSMMRDWEIEHVRDPGAAPAVAEGAVLALVDVGTTERGLEVAQNLWTGGVTIPCLVIGESDAPAGARVRVLVRPFTLHDLMQIADEVAQGDAFDPSGEDAAEDEQTDLPSKPVLVEPEPEAESESAPEAQDAPEPESEPEVRDEPEPEPEEHESDAEPEPEEPAVRVGHDPGAVEEEPAPAKAHVAVQAPPEHAPTKAAERPVAPARRPEPEPAPEPAPVEPETREPRRRFLRRRPDAARSRGAEAPEGDPMVARLYEAIGWARSLETLVGELPVLGQPRAMAHAFLGEVVEMFAPQVAAVFAAGLDGNYGVLAAHGLSGVEVGMKVPPSQPLFMEITSSLEAVLIAPVDLAQGMVAGIGGARTEAIIAAPLEVGGHCHAIVIVGRQDFSDFDMDLLVELTEEAAPGLAVAQLLERLRLL